MDFLQIKAEDLASVPGLGFGGKFWPLKCSCPSVVGSTGLYRFYVASFRRDFFFLGGCYGVLPKVVSMFFSLWLLPRNNILKNTYF